MFLRDLGDVRHLFASLRGSFTGVGMAAYPRITPASFIHPYHIVALRKTLDLSLLRRNAEIFCLEEELGHLVQEPGFNSARLLSHPMVRKFLKNLLHPKYLLLYQNYPELEELAEKEGWVLLANASSIRLQVAERAFFHRMVDDLQLRRIPGDVYPIEHIHSRNYDFWGKKIAPRFVLQFPEIKQGGGRGTFFINSLLDYQRVQDQLKGGIWRRTKLTTISVHKFINGIPASIALCLTRHGILSSGLQRQLIDLPYCKSISENGIFCGHSWGESSWSSCIDEEAGRQARLIGQYLASLGYRGMLGIDFLVNKEKNFVYPVECNPRFTGAFPMLSQLHICNNLIPMDVFHILEFLDFPYDMNPDTLNLGYSKGIRGSHMILFSLSGKITGGKNLPDAGLYELDPHTGSINFVKGTSDYQGLQNDRQFIIVDGPPDAEGEVSALGDPLHRLCRVLFPYPIIDGQEVLSSRAIMVADWFYKKVFS